MPRRYRKKTNKTQAKRRAKAEEPREAILEPETSRSIVAIVLFVLAIIGILSLLNFASVFGDLWNATISRLVGNGKYVVPVVFATLGVLTLNLKRIPRRPSHYIGIVIFVLAGTGFLHLFVDQTRAIELSAAGEGGGVIGMLISWPLYHLFGAAVSYIILVAALLIAFIVFFNKPLKALLDRLTLKESLEKDIDDLKVKTGPDAETKLSKIKINNFTENLKKANNVEPVAMTIAKPKKQKEEDDFGISFKHSEQVDMNWELPDIELLENKREQSTSGDIKKNIQIIRETLENFGIPVEMGDVSVGPTVTQYTLRPSAGIRLTKISALQNDLALALAAHPIRIEAPIPGKSLVGIEIPNITAATVRLRELLASKEFENRKTNLSLALGQDVAGNAVIANLKKLPHLLIAGATGSGKSVTINSIIMTLLFQNSPNDLRLILVDPKRVELTTYDGIPHLLTPVITEPAKTVNALKWAVREMERRYKILQEAKTRDLETYNQNNKSTSLPYIVIVIDELADLMNVASQNVEAAIVRLAQMARAIGIHLIVATQRPSVDVITGLIKANITARVAFKVASVVDSRTILDMSGAEKLVGSGDMLFVASDLGKPRRVQGTFVSDADIERVVNFLKARSLPSYNTEVTEKPQATGAGGSFTEDDAVDDDLYTEAKRVVIESKKASASLLQRRLRVGYARAARLLDILEENGIIGPGEGAKPRQILVSKEDEDIEGIVDEPAAADGTIPDEMISQEPPQEQPMEEIGDDAPEPTENNPDTDESDPDDPASRFRGF